MGLEAVDIDGRTLLEVEEKEGLLIPSISTRKDLNEFEHKNIEQAINWVVGRSFRPDTVFTEVFICMIHQRMYSDVWAWAGDFRKTDTNLGIDKWLIPAELKKLLDDATYWFENNTFSPDETALRFKHRLASIHCFPNGNGRHSRLMADIIIEKIYKLPVFSWGALLQYGDAREEYLRAVKVADRGDYTLLLEFARS